MENSILKFSWWNTGLSPCGKNHASADHLNIAKLLIQELLNNESSDLLGLAEINGDSLDKIKCVIEKDKYEIFFDYQNIGRLKFDVTAIFNKAKLLFLDHHNLHGGHGNQKYKIATRLDLKILDTSEQIHVFLCHWPSRLHDEGSYDKRQKISLALRNEIMELKKRYPPNPKVVIMGDFNDEPFDKSLSQNLLATRDRTLAIKNLDFFYNPFWKMLGEQNSFPDEDNCENICGTCYHRNGHETKWKTFDQIIFSSNFLNRNDWHLNENNTRIWQRPNITNLMKKRSGIFDHLPIITLIQKNEEFRNG